MQSRYYNPEWGRFVNEDALIGIIPKLLTHNLFAYCRNNPINGSDSTGYSNDWDTRGGGGDLEGYALSTSEGANIISGEQVAIETEISAAIEEEAAADLAAETGTITKAVPNPDGKNGGILHKTTISNIKPTSENGIMESEFKFNTPNGTKSYRFADKVEIVDGEVLKIYQVGKVNNNGLPVTREAKAIMDIMNSPKYNGAPIYFIPYNSNIGPIIYLAY